LQIINNIRIFNNSAKNREIFIRKSDDYSPQNFDHFRLGFSMIFASENDNIFIIQDH